MNANSWIHQLFPRSKNSSKRTRAARQPLRARLEIEYLEERCVPTFTTIASFGGGGSGQNPYGSVIEDSSGNLFGTTGSGGASGRGTIFELPYNSATQTYDAIALLASFNGSNGANSQAGLIQDSAGNLFGTTSSGGASGLGTVFELPYNGTTQTYGAITTLATFNGANGANSQAGLIKDSAGNLFGTTLSGGASGLGTVFELLYNNATQTYGAITTLASFNSTTGVGSSASLFENSNGDLFGTTTGAGASGDGTVFELTYNNTMQTYGAITTLANFNGSNGANSYASLVEDGNANLFGTTAYGGGASGFGTVFELPYNGATQTYGAISTLANFNGSNGANPYAGLVKDSAGNLFGTTLSGGASADGTVFELSYNGAAQTYGAITTLVTFNGANGNNPQAGLIEDSAGNFFGTTQAGGTFGYGAVFALYNVTISTVSLPNGTINQPAYNQTINATGGTAHYTFTLTSGTLPPGLTLSSSGVLSGTPTSPGSYNFTVTAADSFLNYITLDDPSATAGTIANGISGSNIVGYYRNSSGSLIHGFLYNGSTYTTLDDPNATSSPGNPGYTICTGVSGNNIVGYYFDSAGAHGFLYNGSTWTTLDDPDATAGIGTYANGISGSNIVGFYYDSHSVLHGFLYNGSTYTTLDDPSATPGDSLVYGISGTYIVGSYNNNTGSHGFLYNGSTWTTLDEPSAGPGDTSAVGVAGNSVVGYYNDGKGGVHGFLYNGSTYTTLDDPSATSGTNANGISGNNIVGYYEDGAGQHGFLAALLVATASQSYIVTINPAVNITTTILPNWTVNQPGYNQTVKVTGGTAPLTFSASGTLPTGLTLSTSGVLSGAPTTAGSYGFTVTATDATGASASQHYTVAIKPAVTITTTTLPSGTLNQAGYNQTITSAGGTGATTFALTAGTLPGGLTMTSTGVLSGTPSFAAIYSFTLTATDALGASGSQTYNLPINGLNDPGFETPAVGTGGIQYDPLSSPWSFHGSAGVTANGSAFTASNPNAPQGVQVAFLQGGGSASQSIVLPAGTYSIGLSAAQRANVQNGGQTFQVLLDGNVIASFNNLVGASYASLVTTSFTVTAGSHLLLFQATDLHGGDNTVFLDQIVVNQLAAGLNDSGFERVVVGNGGIQYAPAGTPWTFHGSAGLTGNGSALTAGNPNAPEGSQVAFIQATGSISQSATFPAGTYDITFYAAQRGNLQAGGQTFQVLVDGQVIGMYNNLVGTSYVALTTSSFTVTAGNHTLVIVGTDLHGGDNTVFVDQLLVNLLPTSLNDSGWESPALASGGIQYNPVGSAWTFSGSAGLSGNGSAFTAGNPNAPQGSQVAFIQAGGSISQSVTFAAGNYDVGFFAAQRANVQNGGQTFQIIVDGSVVGTFNNLVSTSYASWVTTSFTVTAGTHILTFQGTDLHGGDNTVFVDQVSINSLG